jgi:zinc protease
VRRALLLALCAGCAASSPRSRAPAATTTIPIQIVRLPPSPGPGVVVKLMFRSGSVDDPPGREGLTALCARLMAEGGTARLSAVELLQRLYPLAAEIDARPDREVTVFEGRAHRDHLDRFLPILLDVVLRPRLDEKEFSRLRDDAVSDLEKRLRSSDDEDLGKEALASLIYEGHPYGHPVVGTSSGLRAISMADVRAHIRRVFGHRRLVVGVAGAYPPDLPAQLLRELSTLPAGDAIAADPPVPAESRTRVLLVEQDNIATAISLGFSYDLLRGQPDFFPLAVAVSALGEHRQMHGRLFSELRAKRGLNYGDYAYLEHFEQEGGSRFPRTGIPRRRQDFTIWIRPVEHANRLFALRAALFELARFARDGITAEELDRTREFLAGYTRLGEQTDGRRLGYALDDLYYGTPPNLESLRAALPGLSVDGVNAAIRQHIDPGRVRIAIVTKDAAALRDTLVKGAASPIQYPTPKPKDVLLRDKEISVFPMKLAPDEIRLVKSDELFR